MTTGAKLSIFDYADLGILTLARRRRLRRRATEDDQAFYGEFFSDYDEAVLGSRGDPRKNVRLQLVSDALARHVPGGRVLDVGCGVGDTLAELVRLGRWKLFGVEYATTAVERARRRLQDQATVSQASATALPFDDASFDGFTCIEVFEHIEDDIAAMREVARVLRPNARGVVTVPSRHWFPAYLDLIGHHRHYTRQTLEQRLRQGGLRVVEWLPNLSRWHRAADLSYVLARGLSEMQRVVVGGAPILPDQVRVPFTDLSVIGLAMRVIEPLRSFDARRAPAALETTSSCVVARAT